MTDPTGAVRGFAAKWHALWPEQQLLDLFVPATQRTLCQAWIGLHYELYECLFALEHDAVRESKLAWWSQELQAMAGGAARHPLGQALQAHAADYRAVAQAIGQLAPHSPLRAADSQALLAQLQPMATALADCEQALFGGKPDTASVRGIAGQWLLMRLPHGLQAFDHAMLPMQLRARHAGQDGTQALYRDWLGELAGLLPAAPAGNWFRRAQLGFCRRRLTDLRKGRAPGLRFGHVLDAWRARRG